MNAPIFFFIGPPQHGKTEARKLAAEITGLQGASCSDVIHAFLAARMNSTVEKWRAQDKEKRRAAEIEAGDFLCGHIGTLNLVAFDGTVDDDFYRCPSGLIRPLVQRGIRLIDGVRRRIELADAVNHLDWNGIPSVTIWVERPGAPNIKDNTELTREHATEHIVNDGDLAQLRASVRAVLEKYAPPKSEPSIFLGNKQPGGLFLGR